MNDVAPNRHPRILSRYLVAEFLRILALCLISFVALYLVVDFFDRFDDFLKHQATASAMLRYFLFKIPLVLTQVLPVAVLASLLLSLGGFTRHNEIAAMQSCGVSPYQIASPLLLTCLTLSLVALVWNEAVVPHFMQQVRYINTVEIKKRDLPTLLGGRELWSHGEDTFYNIESFDARRKALLGLTIYRIDKEFQLSGLREIAQARWENGAWRYRAGRERRFQPNGEIETVRLPPGALELREKPRDLLAAQRDAEEFNYFALRELIDGFRRKGLDPTEHLVDLHLKLAVPFLPVIMGLLAVPLGLSRMRSSSLAGNIGSGLVIGFSYWVILALAISLGHSGALPPLVAAWTANAIFGGFGLFLMLGVV